MILVLAGLARAEPPAPPPRPAPAAPVAGQCARAVPVVAGAALPPEFLGGKASCGGVLLPSSDVADFLAVEVWAEETHGRYRVDLAAAAAELDAARAREAWWRAQAERQRPDPALLVGAGVLGGVGLTLGAAWALGQIAE